MLRVQPVGATSSKPFTRRYFLLKESNGPAALNQTKPGRFSARISARERILVVRRLREDFELLWRRPIKTTRPISSWPATASADTKDRTCMIPSGYAAGFSFSAGLGAAWCGAGCRRCDSCCCCWVCFCASCCVCCWCCCSSFGCFGSLAEVCGRC